MKFFLTETEKAQLTMFFKAAFHRTPEQDPGYFEEWEYRFTTGHIMKYMDSDTLKIWIKTIGTPVKCEPCQKALGCRNGCPFYTNTPAAPAYPIPEGNMGKVFNTAFFKALENQ
jgi:hypothetical protein